MCVTGEWAEAMMYRRSMLLGREETAQGAVENKVRAIRAWPGTKACWENMRFELWGWDDWRDAVDKALIDQSGPLKAPSSQP